MAGGRGNELDRELEAMGRRDEKVRKSLREMRPDLSAHAEPSRAGWDPFEYVRVSLTQMRENTSGRLGLLQDFLLYVLFNTGPLVDKIRLRQRPPRS